MKNNLWNPFQNWLNLRPMFEGENEGNPPADPPATPPADPPQQENSPVDPSSDPDKKESLIGKSESGPTKVFAEPLESLKELLPEGAEPTDEQTQSLLKLMNEAETPQDLIKGLFAIHAQETEAVARQMAEQYDKTISDWEAAVKESPEYGGAKLDQSLAVAKQVGLKYGGEDFIKLLNLTGAGSNLAMVKFLNAVHKALPQEGTPLQGAPTQPAADLADRLFPTRN